jgi:hypothetical protein
LAGFSSSPSIDQTLLHVEGFDPDSKSYRYRVNQLFGRPIDRSHSTRTFAPFQIQLGVRYTLAGRLASSSPTALVRSLGLLPASGALLPEDSAKRVLQRWYVSSPVSTVLEARDSIRLNDTQVRGLEAMQAEFDSRLEPIIAAVAIAVVRQGRRLDDSILQEELNTIQPLVAELVRQFRDSAIAVLSAQQRQLFEVVRRRSNR